MTAPPDTETVLRLARDLDSAFMSGQKLRVREGQYPGFSVTQVLAAAKAEYDFLVPHGRLKKGRPSR